MERATKDAPPGVIRPLRSELLPAFGAAIREAEMFVSAGDVENLVRLGFIHGFEARGGPAAPMTCADEAGITAAQFKIGDVVRLRSGGHLMTVVSLHLDAVDVAWSHIGTIETQEFHRGALYVLSAEERRAAADRRAFEDAIPF